MRRHLTFANVVSVLALFVALGGTAIAVTVSKNSVGTKQIRKGAVRSADVRNLGLRGVDVRNGSLGGGKITDGSIAGADLADGSVTGADVDEASLDASGFTTARDGFEGTCPSGADFATCVTVSLDLPRRSRVLGVADIGFATLAANSYGACQILVAGVVIGSASAGETVDTTGNPQANSVGVNGVSDPVGPGAVPVALQCRRSAGSIDFFNANLSTLVAGAG